MKRRKKAQKACALTLAACMLGTCMAILFAGCGSTGGPSGEKNGKTPENGGKGDAESAGRYVERELALPEGLDGRDIFQIGKDGDALCVYALQKQEDGSRSIAKYTYRDGCFEEATPEWMKGVYLGGNAGKEDVSWDAMYWPAMKVLEDRNGSSYVYYSVYDAEAETMPGFLFCSTDGTTIEEITPKEWQEEDPELHYVYSPLDVTVMSDGCMATLCGYKTVVYDSGMEKVSESMFRENYSEQIYASGGSYCLIKEAYTGSGITITGIEFFDKNGAAGGKTIACRESVGSSARLDFLSDETPVLCGENGIFIYRETEDLWEQIVDGIYTSLSLGNIWCTGFAALDNGTFYAKLNKEDGSILAEYIYDETAQGPTGELTVYSLYENATLKNIAALYAKEHPQVKVNVEVGISYADKDTVSESEVLQSFNARLLSGDTPDIILLDGMHAQSFIEKGLLCDISDIVTEMSKNGEILKNIADVYTEEDGKVYRIPLKFTVTFLLGKTIDAEKCRTVADLAPAVADAGEPVFGPMTIYDFVHLFAPFLTAELVHEKQIDREALARDLEYLKILAQNGGIVEKYEDSYGGAWNAWDLPARAGAALCGTKGFLDAMYPMAIKKLINGSITCFCNAFTPVGEMGIMSTSPNQEAAKEFLAYALSAEALDGDFYDGFAVNVEALENQAKKDRSEYCAYTELEGENGQAIPFEISALTEAEAMELARMCGNLNMPVIRDEEVMEAIEDAFPEYLSGALSLEETVTKIERSLSMYLAE